MLSNATIITQLPAEDIDRARKFYTEILGLKQVAGPFEKAAVMEGANGTRLFLYQRARTQADHTVVAFIVDDFEAVAKVLIERGVTFNRYNLPGGIQTDERGIATLGDAQAAWFNDSEGNVLALNNRIQ